MFKFGLSTRTGIGEISVFRNYQKIVTNAIDASKKYNMPLERAYGIMEAVCVGRALQIYHNNAQNDIIFGA